MAGSLIRVGKVSSVDRETGMIRVTYPDRCGSTTTEIPCINYNNEYHMPQIGEAVITAHLSNGSTRGVVLGTVWNRKNRPKKSGGALYRKEFSGTTGDAYCEYDGDTYLIKVPKAEIEALARILLSARQLKFSTEQAEMDAEAIKCKSAGMIEMEDGRWKTNLSDIMDRLYALDGNNSGRK